MKKDWRGLMKILEFQHIRDGKIIWEEKNIYNQLHNAGEEFILSCCFNTSIHTPPTDYYLGLDNRSDIYAHDTMTEIVDEPNTNGYARVPISSASAFDVQQISGVYRATTTIINFLGTGSGWGPVTSMFLTTASDYSGVLIATAPLSSAVFLSGGDSINVRMALALRDVP